MPRLTLWRSAVATMAVPTLDLRQIEEQLLDELKAVEAVQPYGAYDALKQARRPMPADPSDMKFTDCRTLAPFHATNGTLWVSTPNMDFVPQVPTHVEDRPFTYFADGMLGPFEFMKWPQAYFEPEPHCIAAPGNPFLMQGGPDGSPIQYTGPDLPTFHDTGLPWRNLNWSGDVRIVRTSSKSDIARLTPHALAPLGVAVLEVETKAGEGFDVRLEEAAGMTVCFRILKFSHLHSPHSPPRRFVSTCQARVRLPARAGPSTALRVR